MSPRAAWRLERLGFDSVFDYAAGKANWMAAGLPTVRADPAGRRALGAADRDPPTCTPSTPIATLADGRPTIVVGPSGVVLGRVSASEEENPRRRAEEVMREAPVTVRADEPLDPLLERMAARHVAEVIVTTPEGRLLGVVRAADTAR